MTEKTTCLKQFAKQQFLRLLKIHFRCDKGKHTETTHHCLDIDKNFHIVKFTDGGNIQVILLTLSLVGSEAIRLPESTNQFEFDQYFVFISLFRDEFVVEYCSL